MGKHGILNSEKIKFSSLEVKISQDHDNWTQDLEEQV